MKRLLLIASICVGAWTAKADDDMHSVTINGRFLFNVTAVEETKPNCIMITHYEPFEPFRGERLQVAIEDVPKPFLRAWNITPPPTISVRKIKLTFEGMSNLAKLGWFIGTVLVAWAIIRRFLARKRVPFIFPLFGQLCIVLIGSGVSLYLAFLPLVFLMISSDWTANRHASSDPIDVLAVLASLLCLVGGPIGSILFACRREKMAEPVAKTNAASRRGSTLDR